MAWRVGSTVVPFLTPVEADSKLDLYLRVSLRIDSRAYCRGKRKLTFAPPLLPWNRRDEERDDLWGLTDGVNP